MQGSIDNVNKTLIHDNRTGIKKSRADSVSIQKNCDAIALEALVPENVQRVLSLGRKGNEIGKKLRERGINEVIGVISERLSFDPVSAEYKEVICGSIEEIDLPYDNGYFDCIIIENTLEYLKDPFFALKKLKHYLSDSGSVIAVIPNTGNIFKINKLVDGQWNSDDMNSSCEAPLRFFTRKEIEKLFADAGFELSGLSAGSISQEYQEIEITASNNIAEGRVILKGLSSEELRDMYTINFLIRAMKKGAEYKKLLDKVTAFLKDDRMAEAEEAVEEYLETHLADTDALILHADISFKRGSYDRAVQSLDKILLFDPGRKDAIELKNRIQHADSSACLD